MKPNRLPPAILFVDDEESIRYAARSFFERRSFRVHEAEDVASARQLAGRVVFDAAILDWRLPDGTGLELLHELRAIDAHLPIIVLTGYATIELAVQAVRDGAEHVLTKPLDLEALHALVERAINSRRERLAALAAEGRWQRAAIDPFVGESPAVVRLRTEAQRVADAPIPLLLIGETGSGKGVLARWIHDSSSRAVEPFVDLNCGGLPRELVESELFGHQRGAFTGAIATKPGLFEVASRGTLFLDEIGDLPLELQPRLLKVVEEKTFRRVGDVQQRHSTARILAATHNDLAQKAKDGEFRADLYYRLSAVTLRVPPLRERGSDVLALAAVLLPRLAAELGRPVPALTAEAEAAMLAYPWPGNVRELRNVLERVLLLRPGRAIGASELELGPGAAQDSGRVASLREAEKQHLETALAAFGWNVDRASVPLGISRSALYEKLRRHGISVRVPRRSS